MVLFPRIIISSQSSSIWQTSFVSSTSSSYGTLYNCSTILGADCPLSPSCSTQLVLAARLKGSPKDFKPQALIRCEDDESTRFYEYFSSSALSVQHCPTPTAGLYLRSSRHFSSRKSEHSTKKIFFLQCMQLLGSTPILIGGICQSASPSAHDDGGCPVSPSMHMN